jgi:hypothetical protein
MKGGDTDTNAAIVGCMIGALHGVSGIPDYMSGPVLAFDCCNHHSTKSLNGYKRPAAYKASNVLSLLSLA